MPLPTFLCIGVMKCGTTTLFNYLEQHPDVFVPKIKEVDWFSKRLISAEDYAALFPADCMVRGELSPAYIYHIDDIADYCPDVKLILCLREPISQFVSALRHWRLDNPGKSFDVQQILNYPNGYPPWQIVLYKPLIEKILDYDFALHLINFDDLVRDQQTVFDQVADYLEVPRFITDYIHANSSAGREPIVLTSEQIAILKRIHMPSLDYLHQCYGIEFIETY
jgi:hypothetical protein